MVPALLCTTLDRGDTATQIPVGRRRAGRRPVHDLPGAGYLDRHREEARRQRSAREGRGARVVATPPRRVYTKQVEEILKRNIFCSTCPPILPVAGAETGPPPPSAAAAHRAQPQAARDHVRAAAGGSALVDGDHPRQRREVAPAHTAWAPSCATRPSTTSSRTASISTSGTDDASTWTCSIGRSRRRGAPRRGRRAPSTDPLSAELDKGIKKLGEHNYEVQRAHRRFAAGQHGRARQGGAHRSRDA